MPITASLPGFLDPVPLGQPRLELLALFPFLVVPGKHDLWLEPTRMPLSSSESEP